MKTIKLKNATLELSAEDIAELRKQLEEPKSWPEVGDDYWGWNSFGRMPDSCMWEGDECEKDGLARGELFRTKEECEEDDKKRRALVRIKDFIRKEGLEFVPDWEDKFQAKHYIFTYQGRISRTEEWDNTTNTNPLTGYFRTHEDKIKVIDNCEADLKILFNLK